MTDETKKRIFEMRKSGLGYKAIAANLNMSLDSVKAYCKRNNLGGEGCFIEINLAQHKGTVCEKCGTPVAQPVKGCARRFCSEECRRNWWDSHPDQKRPKSDAVYLLTCAHYGKLPIALCVYPMLNSTMTNAIVLDLFARVGSTLIAAEQIRRVCFAVESDPKYCDVTVQRYIALNDSAKGVVLLRDCKQHEYSFDHE